MLAFLVFAFSLLLVPCNGATDQSSDITSMLNVLPECSVKCLIEAVAASNCSATDATCICTTASLQYEATTCIQGACTVRQGLFTKNATTRACGAPIRNKSSEYMGLAIAFSIPANLILILRILFKVYERNPFTPDDYMVVATLMSGASSSVINVLLATKGLGRDVWTITPDEITAFAKLFYVEQLLYFSTLNLLKLSMLFLYLRIFPSTACPKANKVIVGTIIFTAILTCSFFAVGVFPCSPIDFFWKGWDKQHEGRCLDLQAVAWSFATIGILLDLWMLGIPISQIRKLNMSPRKKAGVGLMFLVGLVITAISLVRIKFVSKFHSDSQNPTWDYYEISKWSTVEITIGIICVCLPSMRLMIIRLCHASGWISVKEHTTPSRRSRPSYPSRQHGGSAITQDRDDIEILSIKSKGNDVETITTREDDVESANTERVDL